MSAPADWWAAASRLTSQKDSRSDGNASTDTSDTADRSGISIVSPTNDADALLSGLQRLTTTSTTAASSASSTLPPRQPSSASHHASPAPPPQRHSPLPSSWHSPAARQASPSPVSAATQSSPSASSSAARPSNVPTPVPPPVPAPMQTPQASPSGSSSTPHSRVTTPSSAIASSSAPPLQQQQPSLAVNGRATPRSRVPTIVVHETVEAATGFGRGGVPLPRASGKLLSLIRGRAVAPAEILRAFVAGSARADAPYNMRVLHLLHWLMLAGGPRVLSEASVTPNAKRATPAFRVIADIHRAAGGPGASDELLSDELVKRIRIADLQDDAVRVLRSNSGSGGTVEATGVYAVALARKLEYAGMFPEVEGNFSLDRYNRTLRLESCDAERAAVNAARQQEVFSREMYFKLVLLVHAEVAALAAVKNARANLQVVCTLLGEVSNACVFTEYVAWKIGIGRVSDVKRERRYVLDLIKEIEREGTAEAQKTLRSSIDESVLLALEENPPSPLRPNSKHRREIVCQFSSFSALHAALAPPTRTSFGSGTS